MDLSFLPASFPDTAKVWIYQASRALTPDENQFLSAKAKAFASGWTAHKMALQAEAAVVNNLLLLLIVDENQASVSGCSIDSSVHFVKEVGTELGIDFFNRLNIAYLQDGEVHVVHFQTLVEQIKLGTVNASKVSIFNNLVGSVAELKTKWLVPVGESWIASRL
jgi:hypothetical protein